MQNRAARIICKEFDWNISSTVLHSRLGWMNIETRRDYFAGILMFKTIQGYGLNYLSSELTYTNQYHNYSTSAASNNIFVLSKPNCKIYKTSFRYYAVNLWNSLPDNVKLCENIAEFRRVYTSCTVYICYIFYSLLFCYFVYLSGPC